ncbi:MAG: 3-dehydroquinate synthase [Oscillatoriales cyanobacterium]|nr:MAG: 3-dehydroquinate synthase [Oscillatoriales cyanobacterium]
MIQSSQSISSSSQNNPDRQEAKTIRVALPANPYDIRLIAAGLDAIGSHLSVAQLGSKLGKKIAVVSNPEIFNLYGDRVLASLEQAGFETLSYCFEPGETHKTFASVQGLFDALLAARFERSSTLLALGGGIVGDMTGFAAATWLRGLNFVQVPTSLLAMVDASVGGKTGVNHPQGKNLIGAFYQPKLVMIDPDVLATLPEREFRAGMAEVIKYGVIWDADLFAQLEAADRLDTIEAIDPTFLLDILGRSTQAKADVVIQDEKEGGLRAILNYGHTIGHALESLTGYRAINHGEAVAIGMVAVARIMVHMGLWDGATEARQLAVIQKAGLPTTLPEGVPVREIVDRLKTDKKVQDGRVRFIVSKAIGSAFVTDSVTDDLVTTALETLTA